MAKCVYRRMPSRRKTAGIAYFGDLSRGAADKRMKTSVAAYKMPPYEK